MMSFFSSREHVARILRSTWDSVDRSPFLLVARILRSTWDSVNSPGDWDSSGGYGISWDSVDYSGDWDSSGGYGISWDSVDYSGDWDSSGSYGISGDSVCVARVVRVWQALRVESSLRQTLIKSFGIFIQRIFTLLCFAKCLTFD